MGFQRFTISQGSEDLGLVFAGSSYAGVLTTLGVVIILSCRSWCFNVLWNYELRVWTLNPGAPIYAHDIPKTLNPEPQTLHRPQNKKKKVVCRITETKK